ncbi:hypothetical protein HYV50_00665 [Candidatus Pacearchaeota archaeon]|nr:hypothetical protein [Candidatus Pacearchaeota archaeon]
MVKLPKILVVDANILFSFFKSNSVRRQVTKDLLDNNCKILSPQFVLEELYFAKEKIIKFGGVSIADFEFIFFTLRSEIIFFSEEEYEDFLAEAHTIPPHIDSPRDDPYFALALARNIPIWSDEKAFKKQSKIKVFSTEDLLRLLSSNE